MDFAEHRREAEDIMADAVSDICRRSGAVAPPSWNERIAGQVVREALPAFLARLRTPEAADALVVAITERRALNPEADKGWGRVTPWELALLAVLAGDE